MADDHPLQLPDSSGYQPTCDEDSTMALSHPPFFSKPFRRLRFLPIGEPPEPVCCTNVVHNRPSGDGSTRCDERAFSHSNCCTSVVHKPSKTASAPSSRTPQDSGRRHSGLIVRGRVFYLRMRVPRSLEGTVGRTHLWRSLRTANKAEAIRQARIVAYDLEVALRGEPEPRADRPQIAPEAPQKADATVPLPAKAFREDPTDASPDLPRRRDQSSRRLGADDLQPHHPHRR